MRIDSDANRRELERGHEVVGPSVITGREPSHLLDTIEETCNEVALTVDPTPEGEGVLRVARGGMFAQGRAVEKDTLAGVDLRLAIERQMVGIFRHEHLGDRRLGGNATLDQPRRCRRLDHDPFAGSAAVAWATGDEHGELGRNDVEAFGDVLANDMQGMPAAWKGLVLDVNDGLDPRPMGRQRAPVCSAFGGAIRPHCRGRGLFGCFVSRNALLDLLEAEQELVLGQRLGASADAVTLQLL